MVECKASIYDEPEPPLVPATLASNEVSAPPQGDHNDTGGIATPHSAPSSPRNNDEGPTTTTTTTTNSPDDNKMVAAGTAGAVLGFFMGGPLISALLGFGAAYATQKPGAPGDAARALGDVAISTKEKAKELDEKHHIVDRSKKAATEAWEKTKECDHCHNVLDTLKNTIVFIWGALVNFVQENRLLERGVDGVGLGYEYVVERVSGESSSNDTNKPQTERANAT